MQAKRLIKNTTKMIYEVWNSAANKQSRIKQRL